MIGFLTRIIAPNHQQLFSGIFLARELTLFVNCFFHSKSPNYFQCHPPAKQPFLGHLEWSFDPQAASAALLKPPSKSKSKKSSGSKAKKTKKNK